jgi:hypothetical protein
MLTSYWYIVEFILDLTDIKLSAKAVAVNSNKGARGILLNEYVLSYHGHFLRLIS